MVLAGDGSGHRRSRSSRQGRDVANEREGFLFYPPQLWKGLLYTSTVESKGA